MDENRNVSYIVYESAMVRAERTIKRLTIIAVISIVLMFASNIVWTIGWMQFDTISYEQDGEGINNVNLGEQGNISNGAESEGTQAAEQSE